MYCGFTKLHFVRVLALLWSGQTILKTYCYRRMNKKGELNVTKYEGQMAPKVVWPAVVCNPIWWEMLVGGQSITSLMHNTACWKSIWDSKANFHVTWGFFFFFSAPIYRDIVVGFYWAPFIKISLKTFLEVKTPPSFVYVLFEKCTLTIDE